MLRRPTHQGRSSQTNEPMCHEIVTKKNRDMFANICRQSRHGGNSALCTADTSSARSIFEVLYCGRFRARSISWFVTVDTPCTSSILGFCTVGTAASTSIGSISSVGQHCSYCDSLYQNTLNMPTILGVPISSILGPSVHRVDNFMPITEQKTLTFTDRPTIGRWSKLLFDGSDRST